MNREVTSVAAERDADTAPTATPAPPLAPLAPPAWQTLGRPERAPLAQPWLMTFADLTALLVCFFVLLFATQVIDRDRWEAVVGSLKATFSPAAVVVSVMPHQTFNAMPVIRTQRNPTYLDSLLRQRLSNDPVWSRLTGTPSPQGDRFGYAIPPELADVSTLANRAAWQRLGAAVRTFPTPKAVVVRVPAGGDWQTAAAQALTLSQWADSSGAGVTARVETGKVAGVAWMLYATTN